MKDLRSVLSSMNLNEAVIRAGAARIYRLQKANPWTDTACRHGCDGTYAGTDPDDGSECAVLCPMHETERCPEWRQAEKARRDAELRALLVSEGFGRRYVYGTSAALIPHKDALVRYAREWRNKLHRGAGLYLCGDLGTGKSRAMAYLGALLHSCGVPEGKVCCVEGPEMVLACHRSASGPMGGPRGQDATTGFLRSSLFLFVDDVGAQVEAEWIGKHYGGVIMARYRNALPLIMASNLAPKQLYELIGERAADRMGEVGSDGKPLFETLIFDNTPLRVTE